MVFKTDKQRRAFFAKGNFERASRTPQRAGFTKRTAFSYRDGRSLGKFNSLQEVFNRFPSEKKAFNRVMEFRRKTGIQVNNIREIKIVQRVKKRAGKNGNG